VADLEIGERTDLPGEICGLVGFRPTTGRYPTHACAPISPLFDQVGPHARSVADLLLFDAALSGGEATASSRASFRSCGA
jgi:mandelamide amidase